ncbi:MAG: hypothetical protein ACSHYB_18675 [Roseibacillus sp.]
MRALFLCLLTAIPAVAEKTIDLVEYGREVFHTVGCAECHSETKDDTSIKTGPGLYALLQKDARKRDVLAGGEQHRQTIKADLKYLQQSLRNPNADLAIAEQGPRKGEAYLPVMPPYNKDFLSDFKVNAIYQYLLTLNDEENRGPAKLITEDKSGSALTNVLDDPNEILVTDRTRIYRTRIKGQSARAVYVGTPSGFNYAFDPVSLSIERIWWGGFLNIAGSLDGRGQKPSRLGHNALEIELQAPLIAPIDPQTGKALDLSFKSPRMDDFATIGKTLNSNKDFADQLAQAGGSFLGYEQAEIPTFFFRVGKNTFQLQFTVDESGQAKFSLKGKLTTPQTFRLAPLIKGKNQDWTISSLPAELTFQVPVKPAWQPTEAQQAPAEQPVRLTPAKSVNLPSGYLAEQIAAPTDVNGRDQMFEPLGMVNGKDGSLIIATRTAGIWKLHNQKWTQIAEGFQDCLGILEEEDGSLIITQKPELTRLRDLDGDGWFDRYETLSEAFLTSSNYHVYLHGPAKGSDGNYYVALNLAHHNKKEAIYKAGGKYMGAEGGYRGWALQVTPDGKTNPFASGLRSPAGLATGPDGQLYYTENQGEYVGTSKLFLLEKDKFYGHPSGLVDLPSMNPDSRKIRWDRVKDTKEKALALMPHSRLANAPGSPAWKPEAPANAMWVGDQTLSTLFQIKIKPNHEAVLIPFADGFPSGVMRLAFADGNQLYVGQTGRGWRAKGGSEHALVIIKRTSDPLPNELQDITRKGSQFTLHFTQALYKQPTPEQITLESWTYLDSPNYGSPENDKTTHKVTSIEQGSDTKTLTLTIESIPEDDKNRAFHFLSKDLPPTKGDLCEAFFSIVGQ